MAYKTLSDLDLRLEKAFSKAPALPKEIINLIVDFGPYLILLSGVIGILRSGILEFLTGRISTLALAGYYLYNYYTTMLFFLISSLIMLIAFQPLREKKKKGWIYLFYITLLHVAFVVITLQFFALIASAVSFYILYQIKPRYS